MPLRNGVPAPSERRHELTIGPIAPWHTTVTVTAVATNHGRKTLLPHDWLFEVAAEWTGPPAVGFPASDTPVSSRDVYVLTTLEAARALARRAAEAFAQGGDQAPDLRELARS
jgi:hypothetical protein